eukprot:GHVL01038623.1.p1 GENE.GHVL01038623.1~~GHVL01038623.1.p1  ORF type:complete len:542 (+),score=62.87 GHVL01038623.1:89-1714(+)
MGAGYNRMNDVTVLQTTQGLCTFLEKQFGVNSLRERGVVVSYDGRHHSKSFAHITAAVFLTKETKVYLIDTPSMTPLVPYTIIKMKCLCGIQITASHNPKEDNGYKVYWNNGAQIQESAGIMKSIEQSFDPWSSIDQHLDYSSGDPFLNINAAAKVEYVFDQIYHSYIEESTTNLCRDRVLNSRSLVRFVYTPLHGVGQQFARSLFERFGFSPKSFLIVGEQGSVDPDFPTTPFPNPEEKGSLDLAKKVGDGVGAQIILANDPDADRFAACEKQPNGDWRQFSGDEIGWLFGWWMLQIANNTENLFFLTTVVSSRLLSKMCQMEGCHFAETLTGFKYLSNHALDTIEKNTKLIPNLAYEEAIGYCLDLKTVPDKDGITALAVFCEICAKQYEANKTISATIKEIQEKYGPSYTFNGYLVCSNLHNTDCIFDDFRSIGYPKKIGEYCVVSIKDYHVCYDSDYPDGGSKLTKISSQMIIFKLEKDIFITIRTSGTEPKIKWYSEMIGFSKGCYENLRNIVYKTIELVLKPTKYALQYGPGYED